MSLREYFRSAEGLGILSTSDGKGHVSSAIYGRPHVTEDGEVAFVMADRRSHANLQSNPHASYLFKEVGGGFQGKRLRLTRTREEEDDALLRLVKSSGSVSDLDAGVGPLFLVYFEVDEARPLHG